LKPDLMPLPTMIHLRYRIASIYSLGRLLAAQGHRRIDLHGCSGWNERGQ
jgi:hypothetical protein